MTEISSFGHLSIALSGLQAALRGMDVAGHNIANVNTDNYSRQEVVFQGLQGVNEGLYNIPGGLGRGVDIAQYRRVRQEFLDQQMYAQLSSQGLADDRVMGLMQIEAIFAEPGPNGLQSAFNAFWNAWQDLANAPTDSGARQAVLSQTDQLAGQLRSTRERLQNAATQAGSELATQLADVNDIALNLQSLTTSIKDVYSMGGHPNDLMDRRDALLDRLAAYGNVSITKGASGELDVTIGGFALITAGVAATATEAGMTSLNAGSMYAQQQLRDVQIPDYITQLDNIAAGLIGAANALHQGGFDRNGAPGLALFTGTDAASIALNSALVGQPALVAASADGSPGNTQIALQIAGLRTQAGTVGTESVSGAYRQLIQQVGVESRDAQRAQITAQSITQLMQDRRDSVSGVSLDEEMANLMRFQHAYGASARTLTVMDQMLDKLINGTGKVGM